MSTQHILTVEELEDQTALELPKREMLALVTIVLTHLLNNVTVNVPITVKNNNIAVQVCAVISALNASAVGANTSLTCTVGQEQ